MTKAQALAAAKSKLALDDITTFDTKIEDFFEAAVARLYPKVQKEIGAQTVAAAPDTYGEVTIDLSALTTPLTDVRLVEAYESYYYPVDSIFRHGTSLRIQQLNTAVSAFRIYGLEKFAVVSDDVPGLPGEFFLPIVWYMMSEFFDYLLGDKSRYNIYAQSSGARAVDNMESEATYYADKADEYIEERAQLYGSQ
ncbi:hypothetical protein [uncultured Kiloniella sp.]|uniref:hypothetical protein n=1 Tax=uncultured Kiloniella sp. TaxID=1133091 RepID=UPI002628EF25|nr:hypothetical protein [uncultured Kiloniella sp.]